MADGIICKPLNGWIHSDKLISKQGATYTVRYIGCLEVKVSMKQLDFKTRSNVAKECITRVCEAGGLKSIDKKRKVDKKVVNAIGTEPKMDYAGTNVNVHISSTSLKLISLESGQIIRSHEMPRIIFASGGDAETLDFVSYIAKDMNDWRACYILECCGRAKDVIATIGQAFELRYKEFMKPALKPVLAMGQPSSSSGGDADKDYYNDLPGKVPPDVGPPPVPPLPTIVTPFTMLPSVQTSNLIDLNSEVIQELPHHHYVNDVISPQREKDVFDMSPFTTKRIDNSHQLELQNEVWFHGQINRAEAEKRLINDGDFLVRESPNNEGQFVLSGMQDSTKKHLLLIDPEGVVRTKDRMFQSVSHLINFHCKNALPIISAESALVLRTPISRPP